MHYHLHLVHKSVSLDLRYGRDLYLNIPDVDSLYGSGDEDYDLVEDIQRDEIAKCYKDKVWQIIEKAGKVCEGLFFTKFILSPHILGIEPKFILLAGGSTRIPFVTSCLESIFNRSTICNFLNVDEVKRLSIYSNNHMLSGSSHRCSCNC